jgi:glycosyltransferase involved in cell wall biosynthesis
MKPLVSVVIINYNYGRYLAGAVESVLSQDLPADKFEVIVVDDGSTDDSYDRIRPYIPRVRWLPKINGGQVSAFNAGFKEATGEYIALLESDDYWNKDKLKKCLAALAADPAATLVSHWMLQEDGGGKPLPGYEYPDHPLRFSLEDITEGRIPTAGTSAVVFHADRLRPFLPLPEDLLYGADIILRLMAATLAPLANVPEILGHRRIHGANLFGETLFNETAKLEQALKYHRTFWDHQWRFFKSQGRAMDPNFVLRIRMDELQMELFVHRYHRRFYAAFKTWIESIRSSGFRLYTLFRAGSLLLALASPVCYLSLHRAYSDSGVLRKLRRVLLPTRRD